jgi:TfoX-like protein
MTDLQKLINIGPKLAADLRAVGIPDVETLRRLGADEAARRLEEAGLRDCSQSRAALAGALAGVRWTFGRETESRPRQAARKSVAQRRSDAGWLSS